MLKVVARKQANQKKHKPSPLSGLPNMKINILLNNNLLLISYNTKYKCPLQSNLNRLNYHQFNKQQMFINYKLIPTKIYNPITNKLKI